MVQILAAPLEEAQKAKMVVTKGMVPLSVGEGTNILQKISAQPPFHFIFTEITEAFEAATELSIYVTLYALLTIAWYHTWSFIKPGLYEYEKKMLSFHAAVCCALSGINIIITYYVILPATCKFFLSFEMSGAEALQNGITMQIQLEAKIYTYLSLVEKTFL